MVISPSWKHIFVFLWIAFLFTRCDHIVDAPARVDVSLPGIFVDIDSESHSTLINATYTDYSAPAKATLNNQTYDVRISNQGYASRRYVKKSYKLKFCDDALYLNRQKRLIVSAQFNDPTFVRYKLSLKLFEEAGLLALNTDLAGLYFNDTFYGIYLTVEQIDEYFLKNRGIPLGNLYKAIDGNARFSLKSGYQVELGFEKKTNEDGNSNDLVNLLYMLDTMPDSLLDSALRPVLDIENVLNYLAVSVLINNWDGFFHNFYFFHHPGTGQFMFIPYDLDMTFGNGTSPSLLHVNGHCHKGINALFERLLVYPPYRQYYKERLAELMESYFTIAYLSPIMNETCERLIDDYSKDPMLGRLQIDLVHEIAELKEYIEERSVFIRAELENF